MERRDPFAELALAIRRPISEYTYDRQGAEVQRITSLADFLCGTKQAHSRPTFTFRDRIHLFCVLGTYVLGLEPHTITELHDGG